MAVRNHLMLKVATTADLELQADAGTSLLVRRIYIYNPASNYITVKVDRVTVGYFRVGGVLGSHLALPSMRTQHAHDITTSSRTAGDVTSFACPQNAGGSEVVAGNVLGSLSASTTYHRVGDLAGFLGPGFMDLLSYLEQLGIWKGIPVPEGKTLTISGAAQSGCYQIVVYEEHDASDLRATMPNGPEARELTYIAYGNSGGNINVTGDTVLDTLVNPGEFPGFPFGDDVPAKVSIDVLGILASSFSPKENNGTNYSYTSYLKLIKERTTLFDPDKNGLLMVDATTTNTGDMDRVGEGITLVGNFSDVDAKPPLMFNPPLSFGSGEELNIYWTTVKGGTGQNISTAEQEVGVILRMTRTG